MEADNLTELGFAPGYAEEYAKMENEASKEPTSPEVIAEPEAKQPEIPPVEVPEIPVDKAEVERLKKIAHDNHAAFTKKSQENAELRGRLAQIEEDRSKPAPTTAPTAADLQGMVAKIRPDANEILTSAEFYEWAKGNATAQTLMQGMSDDELDTVAEDFESLKPVVTALKTINKKMAELEARKPEVNPLIDEMLAREVRMKEEEAGKAHILNVVIPQVAKIHSDANEILTSAEFYEWAKGNATAQTLDSESPIDVALAIKLYKESGKSRSSSTANLASSIGSSSRSTVTPSPKQKPTIEMFGGDVDKYEAAAWAWNEDPKNEKNPAY